MARRPSNRLVRKAIRDILEPLLTEQHFTGTYPEFRRISGREVHFIWFWTAKYGGAFSYQGARAPRGPFTHWDGKIIPEDELRFAHTQLEDRAYAERMIDLWLIDRTPVRRSVGSFEYADVVTDEKAVRALVAEAAAVLPAMLHWLETREPGRGISSTDHRLRSAFSKQLSWHMATGMVGEFDLDQARPQIPGADQRDQTNLAPEYTHLT